MSVFAKHLKRGLIVLHLYIGLALCLLFVAWFISGVAMVYYRTPVLDESQRLAFAPALTHSQLQSARALHTIPSLAARWGDVEADSLRLTHVTRRALMSWRTAGDGWRAAWADSGDPALFDAQSLAPDARRWFGDAPQLEYLGALEADNQWSYFSALKPHYPLHRFASSSGFGANEVLFSSRTGEPVVATTLRSRSLYYLGPGLHYLSLYPIRNNDPLWRGIVNWTSGFGAVTCLLGIVVGIWQLRWRRLFSARRAIPYAKSWMRWHHWTGLWFGLFAFTFVLSGLFSMNPGKIFSNSQIPTATTQAWLGNPVQLDQLPPPLILASALHSAPLPKALEWRRIQGKPLVAALYNDRRQQLVGHVGSGWREQPGFDAAELIQRLADVLPAPIVQTQRLDAFDNYYYARKDRFLPLPVLRIQLGDPDATTVYVDPGSGRLVLKSDTSTRARRWLYNGLHSFDLPALTKNEWLWQIWIWVLSLAGLAVSVTSTVIAWQWLWRRFVNGRRYA